MLATPIDSATSTHAQAAGRQVVAFGGCNYLGLAHHPRVIAAVADAARRYGLSTSASRTTTGNTALHEALEGDLAAFVGAPAALLVPDGYTANIAAMQTLAARSMEAAVLDERAHRSLYDAAAAAGLAVRTYRHRDAGDAARVAREAGAPCVIATDGVFAADGSIAPVAELARGVPEGSVLLVDDCHGFCVLGRGGSGTLDLAGVEIDDRVVVTTTLAKGLGCAGGAVLGTPELIETGRRQAGAFVCTTPTSPALVAAAREALAVVRDEPGRLERLRSNAARLAAVVAPHELAPDVRTPIAAFTLGDEAQMAAARAELDRLGLAVPLVRYPGGPTPAYFRATVTADHTDGQLDLLAGAITHLTRR